MSDKLGMDKEFLLGHLVTEQSHPATCRLSQTVGESAPEGVRMVLGVDNDILAMLERLEKTGRIEQLVCDITKTIERGHTVYFTGCGATGRLAILLDSVWKKAWAEIAATNPVHKELAERFSDSFYSIMSGGDFALIKSVEGYEDFIAFGKRQMSDAGLCGDDLVVAITEGGETSFVIGTVLAANNVGAKAYFVYNNPDEVLSGLHRCRLMLENEAITKICLASGPMVITGSTRMQATSAEYIVLGMINEMVFSGLCHKNQMPCATPERFSIVSQFRTILDDLQSPQNIETLGRYLLFETDVYRCGGMVTYLADYYAIDIFTDTTERSPTFCLPPFTKAHDQKSTPSWAYATTPYSDNKQAWARLLGREFHALDWTIDSIRNSLDGSSEFDDQNFPCLNENEILQFDISTKTLSRRLRDQRDSLVLFIGGHEVENVMFLDECRRAISRASEVSATVAVFIFGTPDEAVRVKAALGGGENAGVAIYELTLSATALPMRTATHMTLKIALNCVSTLTMCLMERVYGNIMVWVMPSNKKLIDRAARYVAHLTGVEYETCVETVLDVMEVVQPYNQSGAPVYSPVLMAVWCLTHGGTPQEAIAKNLCETKEGGRVVQPCC